MDAQRRRGGFLSLEETLALVENGNVILDACSTLIPPGVEIGMGNVTHPNVRLECR